MKQLYLVRHAQARYDPAIPDHARPLTPVGRAQAGALVEVLQRFGITEIHTSPYLRCVDTIGPFAAAAGLEPRHVPDLRERAFTERRVEDWASLWKRVWTDFDYALPDGESSRQAQSRMYQATLSLARSARGNTLAIASHGNTIGLLLHRIDTRFCFEHACAIRNPDVVRVLYDGESLRWDADFEVPEIARFATRFAADPPPDAASG